MSKRLILILALAFVVGIAFTAYAEVQNVKVSGDLTVYGISRDMSLLPHISQNRSVESTMASIARVKIDADLTDNVSTTVRLLNERYWGNETDTTNSTNNNTEIDLDLAYVTLKEFLYSPLSLTVGRQELHFGSDMIVGDPDTNNAASTASAFSSSNRDRDLTARKAFDAIRATLDYDPLVIDLLAATVQKAAISTITGTATDNNVDLYGINASYKLGKKDTLLEGYWFEKRNGRVNSTPGIKKAIDRVDVIGGRITSVPVENLTASAEAAYQFGKYTPAAVDLPTVQRKAWALETSAAYDLKKVKYTPSLKALYAYFSGDHETGTTYTTNMGSFKGWDPMFENQTRGHVYNALFNQTNAHILGGIVSAKPFEDVTLKGEYYAYWLAKGYNNVGTLTTRRDTGTTLQMTERKDLGQELDITATYDYTEDVQFSLLSGTFFTGAAFEKDNNSVATELIGSMKVTF